MSHRCTHPHFDHGKTHVAAMLDPHPFSADIVNERVRPLPAGAQNGKAYLHGNVLQFCAVGRSLPTRRSCADNAEQRAHAPGAVEFGFDKTLLTRCVLFFCATRIHHDADRQRLPVFTLLPTEEELF